MGQNTEPNRSSGARHSHRGICSTAFRQCLHPHLLARAHQMRAGHKIPTRRSQRYRRAPEVAFDWIAFSLSPNRLSQVPASRQCSAASLIAEPWFTSSRLTCARRRRCEERKCCPRSCPSGIVSSPKCWCGPRLCAYFAPPDNMYWHVVGQQKRVADVCWRARETRIKMNKTASNYSRYLTFAR